MKYFAIILTGLAFSTFSACFAVEEGMPQMPKIKATRAYNIESKEKGEELMEDRGFGEKEPSVRMMNLMMVEGSGFEGMDMSQMKMATNERKTEISTTESHYLYEINSSSVKVGANVLVVTILDRKTNQLKNGLKLKAQVTMTSMDMGTETPKVREVSPGKYQVRVSFTMQGVWALKLTSSVEEKIFNFDARTEK